MGVAFSDCVAMVGPEVFTTNVMEDLTTLLCVAMSFNFVSNGLDLCS